VEIKPASLLIPCEIVQSVMVKIYTRWTTAPKLVREVLMGHLLILEEMPKIFSSETPPNRGYNIVSSSPSGKNVFP